MNPENLVVKLCTDGMRAEAEGRLAEASDLFLEAWTACKDDFDACVAAHYVARHQENPEEQLRWNQEALNYADAVGDERVRAFYPSLYLNLGWSNESLGNWPEAGKYYRLSAEGIDVLPEGPYREMVEKGIAAGRERVSTHEG
jgi:hypothetical protein